MTRIVLQDSVLRRWLNVDLCPDFSFVMNCLDRYRVTIEGYKRWEFNPLLYNLDKYIRLTFAGPMGYDELEKLTTYSDNIYWEANHVLSRIGGEDWGEYQPTLFALTERLKDADYIAFCNVLKYGCAHKEVSEQTREKKVSPVP